MAEGTTKSWVRWQDYAEVLFGLVTALSVIFVSTSTAALWTMLVLGVLIIVDGVLSLAMPGMVATEWIEMVLGVLLFISPWVMGYTAMAGASWVSWIAGALTVIAGLAALPEANAAHRGLAAHGSH